MDMLKGAIRAAARGAIACLIALAAGPLPAQMIGECQLGRDCCEVGRTQSHPYRYALACDGYSASAATALASQGYVQQMFGPIAYPLAAGWMANAGIPGWAAQAFPGYNYAPPPPPDRECFPGKTCCAIGRQPIDGPYARAYDGAFQNADMALTLSGYTVIVLSRVSPEFCNFWWNENLAARGLAEFIADATPTGAIPFGLAAVPPSPPPQQQGTLPLNPRGWRQLPGFVGGVRAGNRGLSLQGGAWTNGSLQNGRRDGNGVQSQQAFDFSSGGDIYLRFLVDAGRRYLTIYPSLFSGVNVRHLSTNNSWGGSVVIPEQTWLYAHLRLNPDGGFELAVALGNYDDSGGRVIERASGRVNSLRGNVELRYVDNYAGTASEVVIGEVIVRSGG